MGTAALLWRDRSGCSGQIAAWIPAAFSRALARATGREFPSALEKAGQTVVVWSPLVLLPLLWWGYLVAQYGGGVFSAYLNDLMSIDAGQPVDMGGRVYRFFQIYFYDFGRKYLPWIFFTVIGLKTLLGTALNSNTERPKRAEAGLLLGWIVAVLIAAGLKPSRYIHYLMPALPAIAIVTAVVVVQRLKDRIPTWAPGTVAILTVISGAGIMRGPLLLSRTISGLVVSMAYLYPFKLHRWIRPFRILLRKRDKTEESPNLPAMASPPSNGSKAASTSRSR